MAHNDFSIPRERKDTFMGMFETFLDGFSRLIEKESVQNVSDADIEEPSSSVKESGKKEIHVHVHSDAAKKGKTDPKAKVRNRGKVVFPAGSKKVSDDKDHFPINDADQARNALSRVAQYSAVPSWYSGSLSELQAAVRSAVKRAYPDIEVTEPKKKKK